MDTTTDLELGVDEFLAQYGEERYWTMDVFELVRKRDPSPLRKLNEVTREQCMSHYSIDVIIGKVYFASETDAITCSAMIEVIL